MQKIKPHLWFDKEAVEAANFYTSIFPNSKVTFTSTIKDTPSGDTDIVSFEIMGYSFQAISAGPIFTINPSISIMVNFDPLFFNGDNAATHASLDRIWEALSDGGKVLMPLDAYPFSQRYGWVQDKYGVSWQLMSGVGKESGEPRPSIIPALLFVTQTGDVTEEATDFYLSVFEDSKRGVLMYRDESVSKEVMFTDFQLAGEWFMAMDGKSSMHSFAFNEGVSLVVACKDQAEIDYFWEKLSAVPASEQCGWCKDKYGLSWQIIPENMSDLLARDPEKTTPAMLQMKKIIIKDLEEA